VQRYTQHCTYILYYIYTALRTYNIYIYIEDKNYSRNDTSPPMAFIRIWCLYYMFIVSWNNNNEFPWNKNRARSARLWYTTSIARLQQHSFAYNTRTYFEGCSPSGARPISNIIVYLLLSIFFLLLFSVSGTEILEIICYLLNTLYGNNNYPDAVLILV